MKSYTYKGYTFRQVWTTTEVVVGAGTRHSHKELRYLYEIDDLKEAGKRPFLTTIEGCKQYIRDRIAE